jgi:hypothetical protein
LAIGLVSVEKWFAYYRETAAEPIPRHFAPRLWEITIFRALRLGMAGRRGGGQEELPASAWKKGHFVGALRLRASNRLSKYILAALAQGGEKVNGFWVGVCQDVLISEPLLAENPIDCRIFFADNTRRKTESGVGGKNP